jgi:hypothetical protein
LSVFSTLGETGGGPCSFEALQEMCKLLVSGCAIYAGLGASQINRLHDTLRTSFSSELARKTPKQQSCATAATCGAFSESFTLYGPNPSSCDFLFCRATLKTRWRAVEPHWFRHSTIICCAARRYWPCDNYESDVRFPGTRSYQYARSPTS